jgi:hypothetical protein
MIRPVLLLCCIASLLTYRVDAQVKTSDTQKATPKKYPKLKSCVGSFCDTSSMSKDQLKAIIGVSIRVTDDKKNTYRVIKYQVRHSKWAMLADEATGKITRGKEDKFYVLRSTPMPPAYQTLITESLERGEFIEYFDIIVTDAKGLNFFAPPIRFNIQ